MSNMSKELLRDYIEEDSYRREWLMVFVYYIPVEQ